MTLTRRTTRTGSAVAGLALVLATGVAAPAAASTDSGAAAWPNDTYDVTDDFGAGVGTGGIIWSGRTSTIQGSVADFSGPSSTTICFTAYAGSAKVDGDSRTASAETTVPYHFLIGDPNLVGGFDRLKIQVCRPQALETCSAPVMLHRDGVGEFGYWRP